jgi:hypothetical protein
MPENKHMPKNEESATHGSWSNLRAKPSPRPSKPLKPPVSEDTLKAGHVQIERKTFAFHLKENIRGRLSRITEEQGGN